MSNINRPALLPWVFLSAAVIFCCSWLSFSIILVGQLILCGYLSFLFRTRLSFSFFLFPVFVFVFGQSYEEHFLTLGDGERYVKSARALYEYYLLNPPKIWFELFYFPEKILFYFHHIGASPQVFIVDEIWGTNSDPRAYYYLQGYLLLVYAAIIARLSLIWRVLTVPVAEIFTLFMVLSPSFFELGYAITRHYFTFFSLVLFYLSLSSLRQTISFGRILVLAFAIVALLLGKVGYLVLAPLAFITPYLLRVNWSTKLKIGIIILLVSLMFLPLLISLYERYSTLVSTSGSTVKVGGVLLVPYKYIMALFSPFPWYNFNLHYNIYGGSKLFFFVHILSCFTGVYLLTRLILNFKNIVHKRSDENDLIFFGGIMSTSIIFGTTGFHIYLSIFFPFFAPFLLTKQKNVSLLLPIVMALCLNYIMAILRNEI